EQLVTVVNEELGHGLSVNKTCDKLGIKKTTLRDHMGRNGYEYYKEQHRYVKTTQDTFEGNEESKSRVVRQDVTASNKGVVTQSDIVTEFPIPSSDVEILKEMIEQYKRHKSMNTVPTGSIVVELPPEENGDYRKTLRLNKTIYQDFEKFCNKNKEFTIKELVSQALKEFIEKYS
ncbi:MAG: hypothetical protein ACRC7N_20575, partial [Clostridium sp.]